MTEARARLNTLPYLYPRLFPGGPLDWGFEHGDGWEQLIVTLCERANTILEGERNAVFSVRQVKEKFGELRFYYHLENAKEETASLVRQAVDQASAVSIHVCEACGQPGRLQQKNGWWATRCVGCQPDGD